MGPDGPGTADPATRDPHEAYLGELAGYVIGALDAAQVAAVEAHLGSCDICREELPLLRAAVSALPGVPPEAFVEGPPADADLLVRRTLRRMAPDAAPAAGRSWRVATMAAAAAVIAIVVGIAIGRGTAPRRSAAHLPTPAPSASSPAVPGTRAFALTDPATGARLSGTVVPAKGWVRISLTATGIPAGLRCVLLAVPKSGPPVQAGSWVVSADGALHGTALQGTAFVPIDQLAAIRVMSTTGRVLVTAPV